jgi:hypothetical protein
MSHMLLIGKYNSTGACCNYRRGGKKALYTAVQGHQSLYGDIPVEGQLRNASCRLLLRLHGQRVAHIIDEETAVKLIQATSS